MKIVTVRTLCFLASMLLTLSGLLWGQPVSPTLSLLDARFELDRIAPGQTDGEAVFVVDDATLLEFDITSTIPALTTSIEAPSGEIIDETTVESFGGEFAAFEGASGSDSALISPLSTPGFHFLYRFASVGPGTYRVRFNATAGLTQDEAVFTQLTTNSPLVVGLVAPDSEVVLNNLAVLTAAVFEGSEPVGGASAEVTVRDPTGVYTAFSLVDDGVEADNAAGDGLYSGEFEPSLPGRYAAVADITGTTSSGLSFSRQAAAEFTVVPARSLLTGGFNDMGVDDDGNGLFDRISIEVDTDTLEAGDYRLFLRLDTMGGQSLVRTTDAALPVGPSVLTVDFEADAIQQLGEDGPYELVSVELLFLGPAGASSADRLQNVGQTQAYLLSEFERPLLALTGETSDQGIDHDGNGLFDRLLVSVDVAVVEAGLHSWSLRLTDQSLNEIDVAAASGTLVAGINNIQVSFQGLAISTFGADGPYLLRDLVLFGPSASLLATQVGQTQAFLASQFEAANNAPVADAGPEQTVECTTTDGAIVTIDGSASSDPNNDPLTFQWKDGAGNVVGTTEMITLTLPVGTHSFTLAVDDGRGATATDSVAVTVQDTTPPVLSNVPAPIVVEQASAAGTPVTVPLPTAMDTCDPAPTVTSDAPPLFPVGATTVTFTALDASGNTATATTTVTVTEPPSARFAEFTAEIEIERDDDGAEFDVEGRFTLGPASNGIDPLSEDVALKVGTFSMTIPAGSFELDDGAFVFEVETNGAEFEVEITPLGASRFEFQAESERATLTGTVNPVEVMLTIGNDTGTVNVLAEFDDDDDGDDSDGESKDDDSSDDDGSG